MTTVIADTRAVFQREMSLVLRDPFSIIFSLVQPLVFLGLFGPLLAGSVDPAAINGASPLQWFLPGVIVMICLFGTSTTGSNLLFEITMGSYERVLASPLHRSAILIGKALKELAPLVVQAALVVLVSIPFGFKLYPLPVLTGLLLLGVFGVGLGAFSNALAIASRTLRPTPRVNVLTSIRITPSARCSTVTSDASSSDLVTVTSDAVPSRIRVTVTLLPVGPRSRCTTSPTELLLVGEPSTATMTSPGSTPALAAGDSL